ncbi:MAG: putative DNA base hypermodification protein [Candidatus Sedimenticola sp. (ex Thyasira tokunagai)]
MIARPIQSTKVFDTFWHFAVKRQDIFFDRIESPAADVWTDDPILAKHKFTNAYRAADRVSQYLIRNVIYAGDKSPEEVFFRIILFKLFNKIETWELLSKLLSGISWKEYSFSKYNHILSESLNNGGTIYSAAYIMASGRSAFGHERKHQNHLRLIEKMMNEGLPERVCQAVSMEKVFQMLKAEPSIGNFLAYQYSIDINYSELTNFSENDFVMPGPGALRGISKCFYNTGGMTPSDIIRYTTERQDQEFKERGLHYQTLWGRPLHLIDVQNLFCEVDKYSRVFHPEIGSQDGRKRIKQIFRPIRNPISYWFPPKWGINDNIKNLKGQQNATLF